MSILGHNFANFSKVALKMLHKDLYDPQAFDRFKFNSNNVMLSCFQCFYNNSHFVL